MYQFALCDDDKRTVAQMEYFFKMNAENVEFKVYSTGDELLEAVENNTQFDVVIIGNMLRKFNGIQIAKKLRSMGVKSYIIFVSGIECFYYDAFEVEAFRFIKKPVDWKKFRTCIQSLLEKLNNNNKYFYYKKDNTIHKIHLSDIMYLESSRRVVNIVTQYETYSYYDRLDLVEAYIKQKNCTFLRIHKSYLVNSDYIEQYEYSKMKLTNGHMLPISENKRIAIRKEYMDIIEGYVCGSTMKAIKEN